MTNAAHFDFAKFVPGFDFLKNLSHSNAASTSSTPGWVAPTLDPEELEKRIQELKTVQFWLEQNVQAVGATIQALEVQRMTLVTLKGMNMSLNDLAESLKVKPPERAAPTQKTEPVADVSQWWGALTDQFQHIATHAVADMTQRAKTHAETSTHTPKAPAEKPGRKAAARKPSARPPATKSKR